MKRPLEILKTGKNASDYLENDYFEEVVEACKEILKYTDN
jgi:hypothetical protein